MKTAGEPLDNQTWQTECKTAPMATVQLCEYKTQNLEVFVATSHLYTMFDCPVARQNLSLLVATAHDRVTGLLRLNQVCLPQRAPASFRIGQKLEAVDKRNPSLVRAATVSGVEEYRVRVHYDGWDDIYDDWFDADSYDLHPVEWCSKTGHPLETPLSKCLDCLAAP